MPRKKKNPRGSESARDVRSQNPSEDEALVEDTAAVFTCSTDICKDFASQCEVVCDNLEADIIYNRIALEIWRERPGRAQELIAALADLLAEQEHRYQAMIPFQRRFTDLAAAPDFQHEHLEPPEPYRDLIRRRAFEESFAPKV